VDRGGAAKPRPMEILQHGPTACWTLENADHQNAIAILPPKSHSNLTGYSLKAEAKTKSVSFDYIFGEGAADRLALHRAHWRRFDPSPARNCRHHPNH
jgi:hypothetical protein